MNNNQMNFDPMTGEPINNNTVSQQNIPIIGLDQPQTNAPIQQPVQPQITEQPTITTQQAMQYVPNVEQSKQDFINNTHALTPQKSEEKNEGVSYWFVIILFIIIFAAIFFLFPILLKYI